MHFNENSQRKQAKTEKGEDRWVVIYPKVHQGEKSIARKIKEEATYSKRNKTVEYNIRHSILPRHRYFMVIFFELTNVLSLKK